MPTTTESRPASLRRLSRHLHCNSLILLLARASHAALRRFRLKLRRHAALSHPPIECRDIVTNVWPPLDVGRTRTVHTVNRKCTVTDSEVLSSLFWIEVSFGSGERARNNGRAFSLCYLMHCGKPPGLKAG